MRLSRLAASAIVLLCSALTAEAQVRLPPVNLPELPVVTDSLDRTLDAADGTLQSVDLRDLRRVQVRTLLRRHRDVLERDPNGEPVVRGELLSFEPAPQSLQRAQAEGFAIAREQHMDELGTRIVVLLAPRGMSLRRALKRLQTLDPQGSYDYNHVYTRSGAVDGGNEASRATAVEKAPAGKPVRVGLIDGGVRSSHAVFATTKLHANGCGGAPVPSPHGTAVASLMALQIAARPLELYGADVYCNQPTGGSVTAITSAFAWMARERVPVINVSLVGPANRMLERIVQTMLQRGHVIVAAVGNDGPNAKPLYPAAYAGVVGVTAVDRRQRVIIEALRGPQVDFAAAGADITAATIDDKYAPVRGTSFAAPIVAALMAADQGDLRPGMATDIVKRFAPLARDLGKAGLDPTYGYGLLAGVEQIQAHRRE